MTKTPVKSGATSARTAIQSTGGTLPPAADAPSKGLFSFEFETGVEMPTKKGGSGVQKYDWSKFPAPKDPDDQLTFASAVIPGVSPKTIYTSLKKYKEREGAAKRDVPEFSVYRLGNDENGKSKGVRVFRTK